MSKLELKFLGSFSVSHDSLPTSHFESNKVRALLCYLVVETDRPHSREALAGLLWPDWPDTAARSNLRYALADLRKTIHDHQANPPFLRITHDTIQFNSESDHRVDVVEFTRLGCSPPASESPDEQVTRLCQALALYQGDFLEGFSVPEAAPFEEWARVKREQFHRQYLQVLHDLAATHEGAGQVALALPYAWRQVESEPWHEEAQRQLMRLLALDGQRSAALAQYEACRGVLKDELDVEPSTETMRLYESIRDGTLDVQVGAPSILEELPPAPGLPPFLGLQYFDEADADLYFGREALTARLVGRLKELRGGRFLAVVGASGSGKSSLVRSGLIPAIRKGEPLADGSLPPRWSHRWLLHVITPTAHPLEALATSLTREGGSVSPTAALIDDLGRDPRSLHLYARRMTHLKRAPHLLLVVDQFEELFTLCRSESERSAFIENLLVAAGVETGEETRPAEPESEAGQGDPLIAVIALRADFYDHCAQYARLRSALSTRQEFIGAMTPEELRRAIEEPARRNDWEFEPGLVDLILREVGEEPGALPLLSHALLETWRRRRGRTLTLKGYAEAGGIHRAIAQTAESVYNGLSEGKRTLAKRIFLRLTELGEGTQDTRRRANLSELAPSPEAAPQIESVLNTLVEARLVTAGEGTVEVAHEALIREWPALRQWLEADRDGLRLQRHLTEAAQAWEALGRDAGELYRGARLAQAVEWAGKPGNEEALNAKERDFLQASRELEEREAAEREAQRQRELEAAQRAAEAEKRRAEEQARSAARLRRRALYLVGALLLALVMAGVATIFANRSASLAAQNADNANLANNQRATAEAARGEAETARGEAETARGEAVQLADLRSRDAQLSQSLALAAQSKLALQANNLDQALALAWEANRIPDPPGRAQMALSEAAYAPGTMRIFLGHEALVNDVAVSPDGRYGLSGDDAGVIYLWDLEKGKALRRLEGHSARVTSVAFTPDGRHAVSGSQDKTLIYWDLDQGTIVHRMTGHQEGINSVAVSPDGRTIASASGRADGPFSSVDHSVRLWDLASGQETHRLTFFTDSVYDVSFTPDGQRLAITADNFILLDIQTGKALIRSASWVGSRIAVSNDGQFAITMDGFSFTIIQRDLHSGETLRTLKTVNNPADVAISPDGKRALSSSDRVIEYDLESGEEVNNFNFRARAIAYRPDGRSALISSGETLRLLALRSGAEIGRLPGGVDLIRGVTYALNGKLALIDDSWTLFLWDLDTSEAILKNKGNWRYWDIALSSDGKLALTGSFGDFAELWDIANGKLLKSVQVSGPSGEAYNGAIDAVALDPGGKFALLGSQGSGDIFLFYMNLETGKPVWRFDTGGRVVLGVAISPDGRTALSGEWDSVVELWDLETGKLIRRLEGHTNNVWGVAYVDNHTALSASDDGTMILWDLKSGAALRTFIGHTKGARHVAVSPDGCLALSASRDKTLILWDIQSGEPLRLYAGHTEQVMAVAWHPSGKEALSGGMDAQAIRWRIDADLESFLSWVEHNRYVRPLTCPERETFHVEPQCSSGSAFATPAPGGTPPPVESGTALLPAIPAPTPLVATPASAPSTTVAAGTAVWGVNHGAVPLDGVQTWSYVGKAGERLSLRIAADHPANRTWGIERQREDGLLDPTVKVYAPDGSLLAEADDLENGTATDAYLASITLPQAGSYRIEVGSYQYQTGGGYRLFLADPRQLVFRTNLGATGAMALHPDGRRVLAGVGQSAYMFDTVSGDHSIWVWDLASGQVLQRLEGHRDTVTALAISPDGRRLLSAGMDGLAILWDLDSGKELRRFDNQGKSFGGIIFLPDGQTALATSMDFRMMMWDLASGEVTRYYEGHEDFVLDVVLSPDSATAYTTSYDSTVRVWRVATGELLATYRPFTNELLNGLAISPDGNWLLVGKDYWDNDAHDARIALLDAHTGETLRTLEGHTSLVESIVCSPDGRYVLSGSADGTVRLWELSTGKQLAVFTGHTGWAYDVAFSPDGLTAYSTGEDGNLWLWDLRDYIGAH